MPDNRPRVVRESLDRPQVDPCQYGHQYDSKPRLASYWHQVEEVLSFHPRRVLEVGVGSGFVSNALAREGVNIVTLDVDARLHPTIVGTVRAIPLADRAVEVSLCCQVLEHLPFSELANALRELRRVASAGLVVSLPDQEPDLRGGQPTFRYHIRRALTDWIWPQPRPTVGYEHYWEIGCDGITLDTVMDLFTRVVGASSRTYRVPENPYHRFFVTCF